MMINELFRRPRPKEEPVSRVWADSMIEAHLKLCEEYDVLKERVADLEERLSEREGVNIKEQAEKFTPLDAETLDRREEVFDSGRGSAWLMAGEVLQKLREAQAEIVRLERANQWAMEHQV